MRGRGTAYPTGLLLKFVLNGQFMSKSEFLAGKEMDWYMLESECVRPAGRSAERRDVMLCFPVC